MHKISGYMYMHVHVHVHDMHSESSRRTSTMYTVGCSSRLQSKLHDMYYVVLQLHALY